MNCREFKEQLSFYIDDVLTDSEKKEFETHLSQCESCKREHDEMLSIIRSLNNMEKEPLPDNYDQILRIKLKKEKKKIDKRISFNKYASLAAGLAIILLNMYIINLAPKKNDLALDIDMKGKIFESYEERGVHNKTDELASSKVEKEDKTSLVEKETKKIKNNKPKEQEVIQENKEIHSIESVNSPVLENEGQTKMDEDADIQEIADTMAIENTQEKKKEEQMLYNSENKMRSMLDDGEKSIELNEDVQEEYHINTGDTISISLKNKEETGYIWRYSIENENKIKLIWNQKEEKNGQSSHVWKFRTLEEGKIRIKYELYKESNPNEIYETYQYSIIITP